MRRIAHHSPKLGEKCVVRRRGSHSVHRASLMEKRLNEESGQKEYYVHYDGSDRRLDEWIDAEQICYDSRAQNSPCADTRKRRRSAKENVECKASAIDGDLDDMELLVKEHEQVTKVKYIEWIRYGSYEISTWYFSPYPDEFGKAKCLHICDRCMKYMKYERTYRTHLHECKMQQPPGNEIYAFKDRANKNAQLAVFEVYGSENKIDDDTSVIGFFSKEKENLDGNNLACICILPPFQRFGYGKLLIQLSYELSKCEGKVGSPEKPLSDLGKLSYISYWSWILFQEISKKSVIQISKLSEQCGISRRDIMDTLLELNLMEYWNGKNILYLTPEIVAECKKLRFIKQPRLILDTRLLRLMHNLES